MEKERESGAVGERKGDRGVNSIERGDSGQDSTNHVFEDVSLLCDEGWDGVIYFIAKLLQINLML